MTERDTVSHLLRRLTFGPTAAEIDAAVQDGVEATLTRVLAPIGRPVTPPEIGPRSSIKSAARAQVTEATRWWLGRMNSEAGAGEKLVFFWHGHWATSVQKVRSAHLMLSQQQTFRRYGGGDTGPLVRAMLRDPALILWLDGQRNTAQAPNENLARELMELFTLGVGAYTEDDVKAGARVLTGWQVDRATGTATLLPRRHAISPVTLLGRTGPLDVDGYADLLVRHPAHRPFLAQRLWVRYGSASTPAPKVDRRDTTTMLRALVSDPAFAATRGQLVKQPVEWLVGATRQLGIGVGKQPEKQLRMLGQVPLRPPSVGGWPVGAAWLTTSSTRARLTIGRQVAAQAAKAVDQLGDTAKTDRLDALARLLVVDAWTERTAVVLTAAAGQPRELLALALATPEYAVH